MLANIVAKKENEIKEILESPKIGRMRSGYKIGREEQKILYKKLSNCNGKKPSVEVLKGTGIDITVGHLNRIRRKLGFSRKQGRPKNKERVEDAEKEIGHIPQTGLAWLTIWLKEIGEYEPTLLELHKQVEKYKKEHPEEEFRLLNSRKSTIAKKWQALAIISLMGIGKLTELDYKAHFLEGVLGYSYRSSTLIQFVGELERINFNERVKNLLATKGKGDYCYVDGHMIAFWTRRKLHKGLITMLGRIMAGSNAVLAHDECGNGISVEYYPPDIHLCHIIEDYCDNIVRLTGMRNFVVDREINSVEIARKFVERGWELICLLDANEYKDVDSFNKSFSSEREDGTKFYKASWKQWRENDPRGFVIVKEQDRVLVYWGTPKIFKKLTAEELVNTYRRRADLQENSIKHMIAHGALNVNFGIKSIKTLDRTHQRKMLKLEEKMHKLNNKKEKIDQKIHEQIQKIHESIDSGHIKLMEKREFKLVEVKQHRENMCQKIENVENERNILGEPSLRQDRDFRKQTIMTFRTLWLENALRSFFSLVSTSLSSSISIDVFISLLLLRPGITIETANQIQFHFSTQSLSLKYTTTLKELVHGLNSLSLSHKGKAISAHVIGFT